MRWRSIAKPAPPGSSTTRRWTTSEISSIRSLSPARCTAALAQGIGQALLEGCRYDEQTGQLLTGSYLDYVMPRAADLPEFNLGTEVTPCTHNPLGVKGCGESGAIAATAAVMNALTDAIGIRDLEMPASPERVWRALRRLRQDPRRRGALVNAASR